MSLAQSLIRNALETGDPSPLRELNPNAVSRVERAIVKIMLGERAPRGRVDVDDLVERLRQVGVSPPVASVYIDGILKSRR